MPPDRQEGHLDGRGAPKRSYDTKAHAKRSLKATSMVRLGDLHPYRCPVCSGWHIGNGPRRASAD